MKAWICVTQTTISVYCLSRVNEALLWKTAGNCFVGSSAPLPAISCPKTPMCINQLYLNLPPSQTAWAAKVMWTSSWHNQITNQRIKNELSVRTAGVLSVQESHLSCWSEILLKYLLGNGAVGTRFLVSIVFQGKNIALKNPSCKTRNLIETPVDLKFIFQRNVASLGIFPQGKVHFLSHESPDTGPGELTDKPNLSGITNFHPKLKSISFYRKAKWLFLLLEALVGGARVQLTRLDGPQQHLQEPLHCAHGSRSFRVF